MPLVQWDEKIQALTTYRPHQALTKGVGLRCLRRRTQHVDAESACQFLIEFLREDRIAIVDDKLPSILARQCFAKLLQGPLGRGMGGYVALQDSS